MTNRFGENDWAYGDELMSQDLKDTYADVKWTRMSGFLGMGVRALIGFSETTWSATRSTPYSIWTTTNRGQTWTEKSTNNSSNAIFVRCKDDITKALCVETSTTGHITATADSGITWTAKTSVPMGGMLTSGSYPTSSLMVVCGWSGTAFQYIKYSTNGGTSWSWATTPDNIVLLVDMYDGTTGYAVTSAGLILKTTDGAVTWTSTGDSCGITLSTGGCAGTLLTISATQVIFSGIGLITLYDNSAHTTTTKFQYKTETNRCLGLKKLNSGRYLTGFITGGEAGSTTLLRLSDDSTMANWKCLVLPSESKTSTATGTSFGLASYLSDIPNADTFILNLAEYQILKINGLGR